MKWYLKSLKQFLDFKGRARRKEYWMFVLLCPIFFIAVSLLEFGIHSLNLGFSTIVPVGDGGQGVLNLTYLVAMIIPSIAVGIRRMHDVGKSGWFLLIPIYNLILACTEGTKGENEYGPDPKAVA
ncbi:MAG: DUF805 domain-containing protein [Crocinitomicaceae bacterium]|nr:MAG: DUF805 domain-containing protein [Crocinitomicaceae bacterium]